MCQLISNSFFSELMLVLKAWFLFRTYLKISDVQKNAQTIIFGRFGKCADFFKHALVKWIKKIVFTKAYPGIFSIDSFCKKVYTFSGEIPKKQLQAKLWPAIRKGHYHMKTILLAGGAGYIGSHTAVELLNAGFQVIIVDNYSNSCPESIKRVEEITGKSVKSYEIDIKDRKKLEIVFAENQIDAVIHFAGLKAVGESVQKPILYYRNNIDTTLSLLECMQKYQVNNIIFSSSATVYGEENPVPYTEEMKRGTCTNPYGWTKVMMEQILEDAAKADEKLSVVLLRYFNPIGAHESGKIGEDPQGIPNNLMPYVAQVAVGRREKLTIFGKDYDTPDGTCRRDYIHVVDLAKGHVKAIEYILAHDGVEIFNLGTGTPYSVTEIVETFEEVNHVPVAHVYGPRRAGDLPESYANADKALRVLGWKTEKSLADMCRDTWNWQKNNPNGYQK